jgi:hypothetical protein
MDLPRPSNTVPRATAKAEAGGPRRLAAGTVGHQYTKYWALILIALSIGGWIAIVLVGRALGALGGI